MDEKDWHLEQHRVDDVVNKINQRINKTQNEYNKAHNETQKVQQNYGNNTSVNYVEIDDRIETSADLQQQRGLVNKVVQNEAIIKKQLTTYKQLANSPYFGRIDIKDNNVDKTDTLYIGTASFVDNNENFLVYDWRAPIASIYYNGTLGEVSFKTPNGTQKTSLERKRQFQIKHAKINNMFDTNETVGDEMLQNVLGQQHDELMQNIVSTIQKEQNDIIRDTYHDLLVVQGAAGSGKTSAILQRIAFLLYHSRASLQANQIILFSPNRLFSHYISDVLPSLGERNMRQVTLQEFIAHRMEGIQIQSLFEQYEKNDLQIENNPLSDFKESNQYMQLIEQYVTNMDSKQMAFQDILVDGEIFFDHEVIENIYAGQPKAMKATDKFLNTKNSLITILKKRMEIEIYKPWVDNKIDQLNAEQYHNYMAGKKLGRFQDEDDERYFIAKQIVHEHFRKVYDAIFNGTFFDSYLQYSRFMISITNKTTFDAKKLLNDVQIYESWLEMHRIRLNDVAPVLYLRDLLVGGGQNQYMQYLFVDEMQDYSIAQLIYIKHAFPKARINLIGDSEQALFKDVQRPQTLLTKLNEAFTTHKSRLITLNRSYRSTYPITTFAKSILPNGNEIKAFNRPGKKPEIIVRYDENEAIKSLIRSVQKEFSNKSTVAIITKNLKEAQDIHQHTYRKLNSVLLSDTDRSLPTGVVIMPIYLAKGLEFDSVIAWNVSEQNYPNNKYIGILYTIATRAMHTLTMISVGKVSPLIANSNLPINKININHLIN
jgi:DNA helicase II / ATP-dependent DNA helicase PcrA